MEFEIQNKLAVSAAESTSGLLVIMSRTTRDSINLLLVEHVEPRKSIQSHLRDQFARAKNLDPINPLALRENLSSDLLQFLSQHLLKLHDIYDDQTDVISSTAWRYMTLVSWGEASAARELSLSLKVPVHTIHSRLRIARQRGLLSSPGSGSRLG